MESGVVLADEMRALIDTITSTQPTEAQLARLIGDVRSMRSTLAETPTSRYWERGESGAGYERYSPFRGSENPVAPPMRITASSANGSAGVEATVVVPAVFEGPPRAVHGGMIAAMFDEVMSAAQAQRVGRRAGVTVKLSVKYRLPTPTNTPLRFDAWVESETSRRCTVRAECFDGEQRTADAQALFLSAASA